MTTHQTGTREQWLKARLKLLKGEKELKRRSDELAFRRFAGHDCQPQTKLLGELIIEKNGG